MANNRIQVKRTSVSGRTANVTNVTNSQYIAAGELALNMPDGILYSSNGSALITVGSNLVNQRITNSFTIDSNKAIRFQTVNTSAVAYFIQQNDDNFVFYTTNTSYGARPVYSIFANSDNSELSFSVPVRFNGNVTALTANGTTGTAGQVLTSNGTATYWASVGGTGTVTSVATGNGMTGGPITTTGTVSVLANTGIVANSTGLFVNSVYIGTLTANNTNFVGTVSAANVVSNAQLSGNLVNYQTTAGLASNVAVLAANSATYLGGNTASDLRTYSDQKAGNAYTNAVSYVDGKSFVNTSQLSTNLANYQTTAGLASNVATLTANNTSFVGTVSAANVVSNAQLSGNLANYVTTTNLTNNLANYQTTAGLAANVATLTANNTSFVGTVSAVNVVSNAQLSANLANYQTTAGLASNVATLTANNANYVKANNGITSNSSGVFVTQGTGTVVNATGVHVNATYIGTLSANNTTYVNGKTEGNLNVNSATTALTANNSTNLGGVAAASYQLNSTLAANVATLTANNTSFVGTVSAANVVSNAQLSGNLVNYVTTTNLTNNLANYQTTAGLASNVATLTANNADYLDGQHGAYYTNATNITTGTLPYAQIPANIINTTAAFTISGVHTHNANVILGSSGLSANASFGTAGQVLHSNGTATYWAADDQGVTSVATGNGLTGGTITTTGTVSVLANTGIVANATGVYVNATYIGTLSANNTTYVNGKTEGNLNVNSAARFTTARTLTIGSTGKSFDGTANVSWTTTEIGAEYQSPLGVPRVNLGDPTVREMALFDGQFNNKTELYDINNLFFETSTDNVTWSTYSVTDAQKRLFLTGDGNASITIPNGTAYFRVRLKSTSYVYLNALYLYHTNGGHSTQVQVFKKAFGSSTWTQHTNSTTSVGRWPGHLYLPFNTIAWHPSTADDEVYFLFIPTWNPSWPAQNFTLHKFQLWGGYPAGKRNIYSTNEYGVVTFPANVVTGTFVGNLVGDVTGTSNNSSYLGGTAAASYVQNTDSRTLSGNITFTANVTLNGLIANGGIGSAGQVLHSDGSKVYWAADDQGVTSVATGNGMTGGTITTTGTVSVLANTGIVANATGVYVNSAYIGTLSANNTTYVNGKTEGNLNVNSAVYSTNAINANNADYLDGQHGSYYAANSLLANYALLSGASFTGNVTANNANTLYDLNVGGNLTVAGNLTVTGNVTTIGANNLSIVDNFIYLNSNNTTQNEDIGIAGNYNDGTYAHTGIFRDATDSYWKVFDGYTPEPDANVNIDTANASFNIAGFWANNIRLGNSTVYGTINSTSYSGTANNTNFVGTVSAANVVSNAQLSANLANYVTTTALTNNLANYQTTAGLASNVATLTANNANYVKANNGITSNSSGVFVTQGTGVVVNATGVHVNATYIGTLSANNADYLDGQHGSYYTNATNITTGTLPYAQIPANVINTTAAFTVTGVHTYNANVILGAGLSANGGFGTAGQVLHSNGTATYWAADDQGVTSVATGNGLTGGTITATGTVSVLANTGIVANATGVYVNATYIGTLSANNTTYVNGKTEGNLNVNSSLFSSKLLTPDTRAVVTTPETVTAPGIVSDFKQNTTEGLSDGGSYFGEITFRPYGTNADWTGGPSHQLAFTTNNNIYFRSGTNTTWGSWKKIIDSTTNSTLSGNVIFSANVTLNGLIANGSIGTAGHVLHSNGTATYWAADDQGVTSVASGNGITGGTITSTGTLSVVAGTGTVVNATGVHVNATYIGTLSANNTTYVNGKTESNLNVNSATTALTANNATNLGGVAAANYARVDTADSFDGVITFNANVVMTKALSANGGFGTVGQVLTSGAAGNVYWATPTVGDITSVTAGNGLTGGGTSGDVTLTVGAANGITVSATTVGVTQGTGTVVNATGVHVNATYIGTLSANNTTYLNNKTESNLNVNTALTANNTTYFNNQLASYYTNATNITTGTLPYAQIPANIINTTAAFTISGVHTYNANIVVGTAAGLSANGGFGTAGHVLHSNGTSVYWAADDQGVTSVATGNGLTGGTITTTGTVSILANTGIVANATGTYVNATYIGTLTANNTSFVGTVSAANVVSNAQLSGNLANYVTTTNLTNNLANYQTTAGLASNVATLSANNATYLNGQLAAYYTNATNITTGTLPYAQIPANVINTTAAFTRTGITTFNANVVLGAGLSANGGFGAAGEVLHSNGTATYWATQYGFLDVTSAAGTTTLTSSSPRYIRVTGSLTQTIVLPDVSTLPLGTAFLIHNLSSGQVTIQSSGLNQIVAPVQNHAYEVRSVATTGTGAAVWQSRADGSTAITGTGNIIGGFRPTLQQLQMTSSTSFTAGTDAQGQGALSENVTVITTTAANPSGVTLPSAGGFGTSQSRLLVVINKGTNPVKVYPVSGGQIDALGTNVALSLPVGGMITFYNASTTQWYSSINNVSNSSGTVTSVATGNGLTGGTITTTGTVSVLANTGIVANATGVYVNSAYIATISANNASFLGTVAAANYARLDSTGTFAARMFATANQTASMLTATASLGGVELQSANSTSAAFMCFHRPAAYASYFGIDTDNNFAVGGWSAGAALGLMKVGSFGVGTAASGTAGEIRATNNITAYYSDKRLKSDINKIENALAKVNKISGVTFVSNEEAAKYGYTDKKIQVGVIAQEIEAVLPEVVVPAPFDIAKAEDGTEYSKSGQNYKTVQYEKLVPLLIEAIKELSKEIEELKKR